MSQQTKFYLSFAALIGGSIGCYFLGRSCSPLAVERPAASPADAPVCERSTTTTPAHGALSGVTPLNSDIAQTEIVADVAPTPLVFLDASVPLSDGGTGTLDGGSAWAPPAGRQPKGILLDSPTGATKGTIFVDFLGNGGITGATNQPIVLATDVVHKIAVTRIYPTNISDGGLVPYVTY